MAAAVLALVLANTAAAPMYQAALQAKLGLSVHYWINDGLMAIFFLLVGLEIKRELLQGALSSVRTAALPAVAALGGMVVPALIYLGFNWGDAQAVRGWAVPAATDIAFALGVLALVGSRAPVSLKVFLTALAILDDLGAIIIIALFYTAQINGLALMGAAVLLAALVALNLMGVRKLWPYLLLGLGLWGAVLASGVHATLAGVAMALTIPLRGGPEADRADSPLSTLEHTLHPWVAFAILPVFGLANAGLSLEGMTLAALAAPVPLGIAAGLFIGKQIGVLGFSWLAVRSGLTQWPAGAGALQVYGVSLLCGIGFTMSLFIGSLAFDSVELQNQVKLGVFSGSLLSAVLGYLVLRFAPQR